MEHVVHHTVLGFCWWDIPAALILIGLIVLFVVRHRKLKKKEEELEEQLSNHYADEVDVE